MAPRAAGRPEQVIELTRPPSLTALVTDQLRDLIITNAFEMGEQLSENTLSARLGVSRTPVREACLNLQNEKLLEIRPQRGIFVFTCSLDQIRAICELREVLEVASLRLAIRRDPQKLMSDYKVALDACGEAIASEGVFQSADHNLHAVIIRASENTELIEAYQMVSGRARALRYRYARSRQEFLNSQADHERIYELMTAGNFEGAIEVLSHHVYASLKQVERILVTQGKHDA